MFLIPTSIYEVWSKNNSFFQMSWVTYVRFFFCYVGYIRHFEVSVSIFYYSKKWIKETNCIKFCVNNEIKTAKAFEMLSVAFGESTKSRTQVQLRYNTFKEGREDVNDDACPGWFSTSTADGNIEEVKKMILDNRRIKILLMMLAYRSQFLQMF